MQYELSEIKALRKKIGLTQSELAKQANVSQSLIAKIESGFIDPTYSRTQKIFDVLNSLSKHKELKAKDIMYHKLYYISPEKNVKEVIVEMRKHQISQMPVIKNNSCVGLISESILLDAFDKEVKKVKDIMGDSPPIIAPDTPTSVISNLLKIYPIVVVSEKGKIIGVVTKSDLLKAI